MLRRLAALRGLPDHNVSSPHLSRPVGQWIESMEQGTRDDKPHVPPLPSRGDFPVAHGDTGKTPHGETAHSASPKPLTSDPPQSLHKPQALSAVANGNGHSTPKNYENHSEMEDVLSESQTDVRGLDNERPQMPLPYEAPAVKTPDKSFSIKSWLKREPGKRNNSGDKGIPENKQLPVEQETPQKRPGSGNTFSKLRHTVVQKFTGTGSNAKRPNQLSVAPQEVSETATRPVEVTPSFTPLKIVTDNEIDPYMTSLGRSNGPLNQNHPMHFHSSSAERRNLERENKWALGRRVAKTRNGSDISTEYAGLYHTPPFTTPTVLDKDGYASPQVIGPFTQKNDINNNEKGNAGTGSVDRNVNRTRAAIAHGSNISISDVYRKEDTHVDGDRKQYFTPEKQHYHTQAPNTVPLYKSKTVHNYENQVRLDVQKPSWQLAQPVAPMVQHPEPMTPTDTSLTALKVAQTEPLQIPERTVSRSLQTYKADATDGQLKSENDKPQSQVAPGETPVSSKQYGDKQKPLTLGRAYQRQQNQLPGGQIIPSERIFNKTVPPQKPPRTPQMQRAAAYRDLSQTKALSSSKDGLDDSEVEIHRAKLGSRDDLTKQLDSERQLLKSRGISKSKEDILGSSRERNDPQNISSLINRFEVKRQPREITGSDKYNQSKLMSMTSTPVTEKRPLTLADEINIDPPPLPPRLEQDTITKSNATNVDSHQDSLNRNTQTFFNDHSQQNPHASNEPKHFHASNHMPIFPPKSTQKLSSDMSSRPRPIHSREDTGASDDGYKDQLRKAANSSVFERYTKQTTPQTRNIPESSQRTQLTPRGNDNHYTPRSRTQFESQANQNVHYSPGTGNQPMSSHKTPTSFSNANILQQHEKQNYYTKDQNRSHHFDVRNYPANTRQRYYAQENGPTAVVSPTIVQQGNIAFMEI